ncbi:hypothetical protein [Aquabacterium sp.]|uniref:hypothetical protein n=1 Tax=Aquabacterium sp. TaxID=1872578 RepID=UPI002CA4312F|nr:hypothetical protein [Aquabacterium sp.]HSW04097.1 hypothetical protein [Aquabacterium sp.]
MHDDATVKVFSFYTDGAHVENPTVSTFKATPAAIRKLGGSVIEATGEEVALSELDQHGRYRRLATGWGALD